VALLVAKLLRLTVLRGEPTPFVMELPPYRLPTLKGLAIHTWEKTWQYIRKAGTVILGASILLWATMTFPGLSAEEERTFELQRRQLLIEYSGISSALVNDSAGGEIENKLARLEATRAEQALEHSLAGQVGRFLEKASWLAGFDWRTNIALAGGIAAKEIVISTLGTAYSLGEVEAESDNLSRALANDPSWNRIRALSLIIFIMFYSPCFVTVVCIIRETGSWKWGAFSMAFNSTFAFMMATIFYQAGLAMGLAG
jgi:ferrous iron transport protein B